MKQNETKRTKRKKLNGNEMFKVHKKEIEVAGKKISLETGKVCLLYTSDAADDC